MNFVEIQNVCSSEQNKLCFSYGWSKFMMWSGSKTKTLANLQRLSNTITAILVVHA